MKPIFVRRNGGSGNEFPRKNKPANRPDFPPRVIIASQFLLGFILFFQLRKYCLSD